MVELRFPHPCPLNRVTRTRLYCLLLALCAFGTPSASAQDKLRIALVLDGPNTRSQLVEHLKAEVSSVLSSDHPTEVLPTPRMGDFSAEAARAKLNEALADPEVDAVIGIGLYVDQAIIERSEPLPKPVVLAVAAPELQDLPLEKGKSGRKNLTYVTGLLTLERDLRRLQELAPFERIALLIDRHAIELLPNVPRVAATAAHEVGVHAIIVPCNTDVSAILAAVPRDAQAVYLTHLPRLSDAQRKRLIEALNAEKRIVFSRAGSEDVAAGAFASLTSDKDDLRRARRVALLLERILIDGVDAGTLSVNFESKEELTFNRGTAKLLGVSPPNEVAIEAQQAGDYDPLRGKDKLDVRGAAHLAAHNNRDVDVSRRAVGVREQGVKGARGRWLPQLDANAGFNWIDPDRASAFANAERTLSWGVQGRQPLYDRDAFADLGTQKQQLKAVRADLTTSELEAQTAGSVAFLHVLRARVSAHINSENLKRTRANLHLAEARVGVGVAGRDEVYRWQAEVARRQIDVLVALAERRRTLVSLNRTLNSALEKRWQMADAKLDDVALLLRDDTTQRYIRTAEGFDMLRDFMAQRAMQKSPELRALDADIEAQRVVLSANRQSFYAPDVDAVGGFTHQPGTWGTGSGPPPASIPGDFPPRDDFTWTVGVQASLPLFAGNQRTAATRGAAAELGRLQAARSSLAQRIEERVRRAFLKLMGSYPSVDLSKQAATAANKNLNVITDGYRRGTTDIIRLIDAQNQALLSDLGAAEAVYDFLIDWIEAERTTGELLFVQSDEARAEVIRQIAQFDAKRKPRPAAE